MWFVDAFSATKQTIGVFGRLSDRWTPSVDDDDYTAMSWLFSEAVSVFAFSLTAMAAEITPRGRRPTERSTSDMPWYFLNSSRRWSAVTDRPFPTSTMRAEEAPRHQMKSAVTGVDLDEASFRRPRCGRVGLGAVVRVAPSS